VRTADADCDELVFAAAVDVAVAPERAFGLVSDLRQKAPLNPGMEVLHVALLGGEPVRQGSVFHHRLRRGRRVVEYTSRCVAYEAPRRCWSRSETGPPFEVRVTVEPAPGGCRITQEERLPVSAALLDALEPPPVPGGLAAALASLWPVPALRSLGGHVRALQRERVRQRLTAELTAWLQAIGRHLEGEGAPGRAGGGAA
jgi:hypothetical protein